MLLMFLVRLRRLLKVLKVIIDEVLELYLIIVILVLLDVIRNFLMIDLMKFFCFLKILVLILLEEFKRNMRFVLYMSGDFFFMRKEISILLYEN